MTTQHASYWLICELARAGVAEAERSRLVDAFCYVADMAVIREPRQLAGMVLEIRSDLLTLPADQVNEGLAWIVLREGADNIRKRAAAGVAGV